jgi:hypothetical protein
MTRLRRKCGIEIFSGISFQDLFVQDYFEVTSTLSGGARLTPPGPRRNSVATEIKLITARLPIKNRCPVRPDVISDHKVSQDGPRSTWAI